MLDCFVLSSSGRPQFRSGVEGTEPEANKPNVVAAHLYLDKPLRILHQFPVSGPNRFLVLECKKKKKEKINQSKWLTCLPGHLDGACSTCLSTLLPADVLGGLHHFFCCLVVLQRPLVDCYFTILKYTHLNMHRRNMSET